MTAATNRDPAPAAEHRTVARVMSILELVMASAPHGMRLGEISASIDAPKSSVRAELDRIRETRIALNIGNTIAGHIGIASPVVVGSTPATVAIAMAGPRSRMEGRVQEMAESILDTVRALSGRSRAL